MKIVNIILIFLTISLLWSCEALSPSLQAPAKPLEKKGFSIQASGEVMPESDKSAFNKEFSFGECFMARYGITNRFTAQVKAWVPNNNYNTPRYGISLMPTFYLSDVSDEYQFFLTPTFTFLQSGINFEYSSFGSYFGVLFPKIMFFNLYLAASFHGAWAWSQQDIGLGATLNTGVRIPVYKNIDINFELSYSFLKYHTNNNSTEAVSRWFITPLLGIGFNM